MKKFVALLLTLVTVLSLALTCANADTTNYITANYTDTTVTEAGKSIPMFPISKSAKSTPGENEYVSNFYCTRDTYTANVAWFALLSGNEAGGGYDFELDGKYYAYANGGVFEACRTYIQAFMIFLTASTISSEEELAAVAVKLNGKSSTGLEKITVSGMGGVGYKILRTVTIGTPSVTAKFTDTTVTEAGESIPMFLLNETGGTPGDGQYVSNFYSGMMAEVIWGKLLTAEEAAESTTAIKIGTKYYELYYNGEPFEDGRTYSQFFVLDTLYATVTDATNLGKTSLKVNSKSLKGLKLFTMPGVTRPGACKILRTVTIGGPVPATGDSNTPVLFAGLLLLAGAGLIALRKRAAR